ncbi:uncharacterized protein LOC119385550 [Rhipicephalus sanguineus]|uniref:uncharacterized protein LOC119385550 n=1 Tax=Rhipicephalus sanguineus TaxID=34632 RepID=UPI001895841C|nr:uncharacterized protein LOC119385550 [Rhipicephalus sanguineus]
MANSESRNEFAVHPYLFEPVATVRATTEDAASTDDPAQESVSQPATFTRVGNMDWCSCTRCVPMKNEEDCCCCLEIRQIRDRQKHPRCITTTKKFKSVCLNKDVLEVALQQNGTPVDSSSQMSVKNRRSDKHL